MRYRVIFITFFVMASVTTFVIVRQSRQAVLPPRAALASEPLADSSAPDPDLPVSVVTLPTLRGTNSASNTAPATSNQWLHALFNNEEGAPPLPDEVIARWLALNGTNAASLLAARQAGGGKSHLHTALTNFPTDPRVLFAACGLDDGSVSREELFERFKAVAPDNALPDYLSAREHLKNGRTEHAMADLIAAAGKSSFNDYTLDAVQNTEDLYLQAGKSPAEAKILAATSVLLPHLAQFRGLAQDMSALQRQCMASGDHAGAEQLAQLGLQLSRQLSSGEGSRFLINQLVGIAVERLVIKDLDPQRHYDFLQGTVADRTARLDAQRAAVRDDARYFDQWMRNASEADLFSYFDRLKIYGENSAMSWLRARQPQP